MTDPLSLAFGITSLLQTTTQTAITIYNFVNTCSHARDDLLEVSRELLALNQILEWLKNDTGQPNNVLIPDYLTAHTRSGIYHCKRTLDRIQAVLRKHSGRSGPARWAMIGRTEVNILQGELTLYRSALNLTLQTISM